jgi:hypothetical protein
MSGTHCYFKVASGSSYIDANLVVGGGRSILMLAALNPGVVKHRETLISIGRIMKAAQVVLKVQSSSCHLDRDDLDSNLPDKL